MLIAAAAAVKTTAADVINTEAVCSETDFSAYEHMLLFRLTTFVDGGSIL